MSIGSIPGLFPTPAGYKSSVPSAAQSVAAALFAPSNAPTTGDNIAAVTLVAQLQSESSGFRQITSNLAKLNTQVQVAEIGVRKIQSNLVKLRDIARQASDPSIDAPTRSELSKQFKALLAEIDGAVAGTSFEGKKLLDGSFSGPNALSLERQFAAAGQPAGDNNSLAIADLSLKGLFGTNQPKIDSAQSAAAAEEALAKALAIVSATGESAASFRQLVDYIGAHFEVAAANQQALQSTLSIPDFTRGDGSFSLFNLAANTQKALAAQGNIGPALLQLIK